MTVPMPAEHGSPGLPDWAMVSAARRGHIERVAALAMQWAAQLDLPTPERVRWARAVWLHDALRDAPILRLRELVPDASGPMDLLHGPAAAVFAHAKGETDQGVLDAVRYHSVGFAGWERVGRMLYCADFLEPGRPFDREERARMAQAFPGDPDGVLRDVASRRMRYLIEKGWPVTRDGFEFWNSVAWAGA